MPYNDGDRKGSWRVLERHCARAKDDWVARAVPSRTLGRVEAILCLAKDDGCPSDICPQFVCTMRKGEVVLLIRNGHRHTVPFALEAQIQGLHNSWCLTRGGAPFRLACDEVLPPMSSKWFRQVEGYLPVFFVAESAGGGADRVSLRAVLAVDEKIAGKLMADIRRRRPPRILSQDPHLHAMLVCQV